MLSQTNQVIVRSQDRLALLQNICRIAVTIWWFCFCLGLFARARKNQQCSQLCHDHGFLQIIDEYRQQVRQRTGAEPRFLVPTDRAIANNSHLILKSLSDG